MSDITDDTGAEMCIHAQNKHLICETVNHLAGLGCRSLKTNPVGDVGEWKKNGNGVSISTDELFELYLDYVPYYYEDGMPLSLMLGGFFAADPREKDYSSRQYISYWMEQIMTDQNSLFRKESIERMQSPEKIDEYIRVSTPKAWILAAALALIAAGVIVWGFVGSIPRTMTVSGVIIDETLDGEDLDKETVFLLPVDIAGQYLVGHDVSITMADGTSFPGEVVQVREDPFSYEEVQELTRSDWRFQILWGEAEGTYRYAVTADFDPSIKEKVPYTDRELVTVTVVLSDVKPIEYVLN